MYHFTPQSGPEQMPNIASRPNGFGPASRGLTPDYGDHIHSTGFSHEPRKFRQGSRSAVHKPKYSEQHQQYLKDTWGPLVASTPSEEAGVDEVRTWILTVFHRRCHPDPERALTGFHWKGRDLHSQRRYLALRLRFRREPYGYMIAHDIHDALKESRKQTREREKEEKKQAREARRANKKRGSRSAAAGAAPTRQVSFAVSPRDERPEDAAHSSKRNSKSGADTRGQATRATAGGGSERNQQSVRGAEEQPRGIEARVKGKLAKFSSRSSTTTTTTTARMATSLFRDADPFRDPSPGPEREKEKKERRKKGEKKARKKSKKGTASAESPSGAQDPFRDPEPPMHLIDADDFRL
ncbi:hypothetical protein F4802DRAFT_567314 [Xylaria palmicola]|nr:hypothetical protein F4802DRAFT_567314 [Xylaria palmicola]